MAAPDISAAAVCPSCQRRLVTVRGHYKREWVNRYRDQKLVEEVVRDQTFFVPTHIECHSCHQTFRFQLQTHHLVHSEQVLRAKVRAARAAGLYMPQQSTKLN